jgi:peptide/nickel transport system permease protein
MIGRYLLRKFLYSQAVMLGIVVVVFFLFNVLPVDPARMTQGQRGDVQSLQAVRKEFGLDKPLPVQFAYYVNDLSPIGIHLKTDKERYHFVPLIAVSDAKTLALKWPYLRRSYQTSKDVVSLLMEVVPNTLVLAATAMIFAIALGIFLGILSALYKDTWVDRLALAFSTLGISAPSFFAGIIIAWIFGFVLSNYTGLNMSGSLYG